MTAPTDRTGDRYVATTLLVPLAEWLEPTGRAELRLALEELLAAITDADGLEPRDQRGEVVTYVRRHQWTDQETGDPREWCEAVVIEAATHVRVTRWAMAYRP